MPRITKRIIEEAAPALKDLIIRDDDIKGFIRHTSII